MVPPTPVTTVVPLNVLGTLSSSSAVPACVRPPVPVMAEPLKSVPCATLLLRLKASVLLSVVALPAELGLQLVVVPSHVPLGVAPPAPAVMLLMSQYADSVGVTSAHVLPTRSSSMIRLGRVPVCRTRRLWMLFPLQVVASVK